MNEIKHTPGPWAVNNAVEYCGTRIDGPNGRGVAHSIQRDAHPTLGQGITQAEAEANGYLIAAAPDMALALELLAAEADAGTAMIPSGLRLTIDAVLIKAGRKQAPVPGAARDDRGGT